MWEYAFKMCVITQKGFQKKGNEFVNYNMFHWVLSAFNRTLPRLCYKLLLLYNDCLPCNTQFTDSKSSNGVF